MSGAAKGWILQVLKCIEKIKKPAFTIDESYAFAHDLRIAYPENRHKVLRDRGYLEFTGRGTYRLAGSYTGRSTGAKGGTDLNNPADSIRTESWLIAWDSQGTHRTGTAGDHAGADWLTVAAESLGASVIQERFELDRLDPGDTYLEIDGTRIPGVPVFDAPATSGVTGVLGTDIAVATLAPGAVYTGEYRRVRKDANHAGLVIVCQGTHPGMGLLNAEQFNTPYGAPAIHVDIPVPTGRPARLVSESVRTRASARNVVVTLKGTDPSRAPVVVMTPRSSWWQSAAERGGGIVCWLETLRALLASPPACDVILTANSGHELGHLGLDDFIHRRPGWDQPGGAVWVHYGANIGASGGALSVVSADDGMRAGMREALTAAGRPADTMAPRTLVPSGETRDIHIAGGRYATLVGTNPWFHLPTDRYPDTVDVPAIGRIAAGAAAMVLDLTR